MKKHFKLLTIVAVAAVLTACGSSKEGEEKGKVSVESTKETTSKETTTKETTTKETTTKETTTKETTTKETTTKETTTKETTTVAVDKNSLKAKIRVNYNGVEFGLGDKISEVEKSLGAQPSPSEEVPSCLGGDMVNEYYFYGMTIQVCNDVIFSIDIMDNGYYGDIEAKTVKGLGVYNSKGDMESLYGAYTREDDGNYFYTEGSQTMQVSVFDDSIARIWICDNSVQ